MQAAYGRYSGTLGGGLATTGAAAAAEAATARDAEADLRAARAGDRAAMERLLLPHEPMLHAVCRGVLGSSADAEDAVQETFLRALRNLPRFRGDAKLSTWLTRIAVNVCADRRRDAGRVRGAADVPLHEWDEERHPSAVCGSPEGSTLDALLAREALRNLNPRRRAAFLLKDVEGWNLEEVGRAVGWSVPRVKVELYRARKALAAWAQARRREEEELLGR